MKAIRQRLKSRVAKGAAALVGGTVLAQAITLSVTPILARIYETEDFGYLSMVAAMAGAIAPVAGLKLESALMLLTSGRKATSLLVVGAVSSLIVSGASTGILYLLFSAGLLPQMSRLPYFALWVGVLSFLTASFTLVSQFALRKHRYGAVAKRGVYQALAAGLAQVASQPIMPGPVGLLGGYGLGRAVGIVPVFKSIRPDLEKFTRQEMVDSIRKYWRFPVIFAPSALLNSLGLVLPVLFVGSWFSIAEAGAWGMAERILTVPMVVIGGAASQVVEAHMAEVSRNEQPNLHRAYVRFSAVLVVPGLVLSLAVVLLADVGVRVFLGVGWESTAQLIKIMVVMTSIRLVASPMTKALIVTERAVVNLLLDLLRVILLVGAVAIVITRDLTLLEAAVWTSGAMVTVYLTSWVLGYRAVRRHDQELLGRIAQ